jgi:tRNA(fMet)-specific endonuclease VapC
MNGNLVDTNVIIKLLNGDQKAVEVFDSLKGIYISVITAGELFYGAQKSSRIDENFMLFNSFLSEYSILEINESVSHEYGKVKANLVRQGINIPENDIWIAATAICYDLALVTYDDHFKNVENLNVI